MNEQNRSKNNNNYDRNTKFTNKSNLALVATAAAALSLVLTSGVLEQQPAFAHGLNFKTLKVPGAGQRGITIVLGHTNEPTYGAKPGIHDGIHNLEVLLSDTATKLPLTGAQLKVDKYYFKDFNTFQKAKSVNDAAEIQKNVTVASVFGDPGHYMARQIQHAGIYGYRLYGNISYFKVATLNVDTTVFCQSQEGDTSKFNSPGWTHGFGCTEDIDSILFPTNNSDVNPGDDNNNSKGDHDKASYDLRSSHSTARAVIQQASTPVDESSSSTSIAPTMSVAAATTTSDAVAGAAANGAVSSPPTAAMSMLQIFAIIIGIPAAAIGSLFGIKNWRQTKRGNSQP